MGTIESKASYLNAIKNTIRRAITDKGVAVSEDDTFYSYAAKIRAIQSGGGGHGSGEASLTITDNVEIIYIEPYNSKAKDTADLKEITLFTESKDEAVIFYGVVQILNPVDEINLNEINPVTPSDDVNILYI